jgi:hypothetical protein
MALLFNLEARWGPVVKATPRPLYPRERDALSTVCEAGWVPGEVRTGSRSPDRPTGIESLYRLHFPAHSRD